MNEILLAALVLFNTEVARFRAVAVPDVRVFVGMQPGEGAAYAWTKCIPESHVYVVQVAEKTLGMGEEKIRFAAAHEVCHLRLHRDLICSQVTTPGSVMAYQRGIEEQADRCAVELMAGQS